MRRRSFLAFGAAGLALAEDRPRRFVIPECDCSFAPPQARGGRGMGQSTLAGFDRLQSGLKVTGMKVFGVSLTPNSDRPYVFCKLETNQGVVGWGEGTLEGKAGATMACINDFREFIIGLTSFVKAQEVAALFTSTTSSLLGGSSITDGHISPSRPSRDFPRIHAMPRASACRSAQV